jgi:carbamate kinase
MSQRETIVVALGGNALQRNGKATAEAQIRVADETARKLVPLVRQGYRLVIVHGNGPQVGNIVLHEEAINTPSVPTLPLDTCVAMSQGSIGFWLQQSMIDEFTKQRMPSTAATMITQMLVDKDDPAFANPSKPIGPFYSETEARELTKTRGFVVKEDAGRGWRRVVPSPKPSKIVESYTLKALIGAGVTVITAGGGGVPVIQESDGSYTGVEAVIDKDFSAAIVAEEVGASRLIILTAVDYVMTGFGTPDQRKLDKITVAEANDLIEKGEFAAGSMLPKVRAALHFVEKTGRSVSIGSLDRIDEVIAKTSGTVISAS